MLCLGRIWCAFPVHLIELNAMQHKGCCLHGQPGEHDPQAHMLMLWASDSPAGWELLYPIAGMLAPRPTWPFRLLHC